MSILARFIVMNPEPNEPREWSGIVNELPQQGQLVCNCQTWKEFVHQPSSTKPLDTIYYRVVDVVWYIYNHLEKRSRLDDPDIITETMDFRVGIYLAKDDK